jgi:hypothetical protein
MMLAGITAASLANALAGSVYEFVKRPSRISVGLACELAAATTQSNAGNIFTFQIGDTIIANAAVIFNETMVTSGVAKSLRFPDDFFIQNEPALSGDRLILAITRAANAIAWCVIINEVA